MFWFAPVLGTLFSLAQSLRCVCRQATKLYIISINLSFQSQTVGMEFFFICLMMVNRDWWTRVVHRFPDTHSCCVSFCFGWNWHNGLPAKSILWSFFVCSISHGYLDVGEYGQVMIEDIKMVGQLGVQGVAIGVLTEDNKINVEQVLKKNIPPAAGLKIWILSSVLLADSWETMWWHGFWMTLLKISVVVPMDILLLHFWWLARWIYKTKSCGHGRKMRALLEPCGLYRLSVTFHRAFDVLCDPLASLEVCLANLWMICPSPRITCAVSDLVLVTEFLLYMYQLFLHIAQLE